MSCDCSSNNIQIRYATDYTHQVVQTYADVTTFHNAFVTVIDENAVYHVDAQGNPVAVSRSPLFIDNFTPTVGAYKQNTVYDFQNGHAYVFGPLGTYKTIGLA